MPTYLAVQHPMDPATPKFDFWGWRIQRRMVVEYLRNIATVDEDNAKKLRELASSLEVEQFDESDFEVLKQYIISHNLRPEEDLTAIVKQLGKVSQALEAPQEFKFDLPILRPEWDAVPWRRPIFIGHANGTEVRARLPESNGLVPSYKITWFDERFPDQEQDIIEDRIGVNLPYGSAVWDWLFARRLTLLCLAGSGEWPDPDNPPMVLNGEWKLPRRAF